MSGPAIDRVHRSTPPAEVAAAFRLPAVERADTNWWEWPNVVQGFQQAVAELLDSPPPFPQSDPSRGIVIVGGAHYLPSVYVTVRVLRHVGCRLPIEVWHLQGEDEPRLVESISQHDATFVDASAVARCVPYRFLDWHWWRGWQLKAFALCQTRFRQVLYLDADCYPVRNPEYLFEWPEFQRLGAVFWPDLADSPTRLNDRVLELFQIPWPQDRLTESGQMLLDRQQVWPSLALAAFYNQCADLVYQYVWGDKDTFPFAWRRSGREYARMWPDCDARSDCLLQYDYLGRVIFQHRVSDKFKLNGSRFASTYQGQDENRYHPDLAHESFCFHALDELRRTLAETRVRVGASAPGGTSRGDASPTAPHPADRHVADPPRSIEQMYPPVPVSLLCTPVWQWRFRQEFLESGEFSSDPFAWTPLTVRPQRRCVAVSLFKQHADNQYRNQFPVEDRAWRTKYWSGLQSLVEELPLFADLKLRIYVERDLVAEACREFGSNPRVELYAMHENSVGASPGSTWRLLALSDPALELALVTDIDEPLRTKRDFVRSFELDTNSTLGRMGQFASDTEYLVDPGRSRVKNYPAMLASRVVARPSRVGFDMASALRGFMAFRRRRSQSDSPWSYADDERPSVYNQAIHRHGLGWGSHWYMYCFDERFLKHVLYYHFADQGTLHTWAEPVGPDRCSPEGELDRQYVRSRGCPIVAPGRAARLEPLELSPDARRTAFLIDEYGWVFARLLELMHRHSRTGYCGNLFFDQIGQPECLEHVPKQIALFDAARHASHALEIGFNAGHSAALQLAANPRLRIRAFDTCFHDYTLPCLAFLNQVFGDRVQLVQGPSQSTVPNDAEAGYDLLHIDGDHTLAAVRADLEAALAKAADGAVVVLDDCAPGSDVERAAGERRDLVRLRDYCRRGAGITSAQAIFRHQKQVAVERGGVRAVQFRG